MQRIVRQNPNGIDENEVAAIDAFERSLPSDWLGYANYELRDPREPLIRQREIDVILVTHDRVFLIDLKNWRGAITNIGGQWAQDDGRGRPVLREPSPILKLSKNAKKLAGLMRKELLSRNTPTPIVEHFVVMCAPQCDFSQLPPAERARTRTLPDFIALLSNEATYDGSFIPAPPPRAFNQPVPWSRKRPFCAVMRKEIDHFFRLGKNFEAQKLWFADAYPVTEKPRYSHPSRIYEEYNVSRYDDPSFLALLRVWDFARLPARASAPSFRQSIAKREMNVLHRIETEDYDLYRDGVLMSETRDESVTMRYWEIFRRTRSMARLRDALAQSDLSQQERLDNARILFSRVTSLHRIGIAHTDISENSVWLDRERNSVILSNFGAAHFPEVESLREFRAYLAAAEVPVPEDLTHSDGAGSVFARDVYLAGAVIWLLLTGRELPLDTSLAIDHAALDAAQLPENQRAWFVRALSADAKERFTSSDEAFTAFVAATDAIDKQIAQRRLQAFRRDDEPYLKYPVRDPKDVLKQGNAQMWIHEADQDNRFVVKMWPHRARPEDRLPQILAFFDRVNMLWASPLPWAPEIVDFGLTDACLFVVERLINVDDLKQIQVERLTRKEASGIIAALIAAVTSLHQLGLSHGDLKPEHVKAGATEDGNVAVFLIDLHDYREDGRRAANTAYATPVDDADSQTDDRYAVCKITAEMSKRLVDADPEFAASIKRAADRCGDEEHAWRTLAPLSVAIDKYRRESTKRQRIEIRVPSDKITKPCILQADGDVVYLVAREDNSVSLFGANKQIRLNLQNDADVRITRATTADLQWASRVGKALEVDVVVKAGPPPADIGEVRKLLEHFAAAAPDRTETRQYVQTQKTVPQTVPQTAPTPSPAVPQVNIHRLWEDIIAIEMEQRPSVVAAGAPIFDEALGLHLIPCGDIDASSFDFDDADIEIKKHDRPIAILDPYNTQSGYLAVRDLQRVDAIRENDRLILESALQGEDLRRRSTAVARVLKDEAVIPGLIDYFNPSAETAPFVDLRNLPNDDDLSVYGLNDGQKRAFTTLWKHRPLGLLQGPPGTGKTDFIAAFVHYAITKANLRNVLVLSQSHEAANAVTSRIKGVGLEHNTPVSMLRFGRTERISEDLLPIHAGAIQNGYRETFLSTLPLRIVEFAQRLGIPRSFAKEAFEVERTLRALMHSPRLVDVTPDTRAAEVDYPALSSMIERFEIPQTTTVAQLRAAVHDALAERMRVTNPKSATAYRELLALAWNWDASLRSQVRTLESFLAQTRSVVCGTCVGAGKRHLGIDSHVYDLVVVDEAARCGPGELAVAVQSAAWVILVGDHKQLPPVIDSDVLDELKARLQTDDATISKSDFERVFRSPYGGIVSATLTTQYRMAPAIRELVSTHFYQEEQLEDGRGEPPAHYDLLPEPFALPVSWYDTSELGDDAHEHRVGDSYNNAMEARIIVDLLRRIHRRRAFWDEADDTTNIGVICMYAEQRRMVREYVQGSDLPDTFKHRVKIDTVDGYQGQQNHIIIVSLVRNNPWGRIGFVRDEHRANVALSRARERLVLVGAASFFENSRDPNNAFRGIPEYLRNTPRLGNRLIRATAPEMPNG